MKKIGQMITRLCRRGEAWCGTIVDYNGSKCVYCHEPAAVAYRPYDGLPWSYACAECFGYEETKELRESKGGE